VSGTEIVVDVNRGSANTLEADTDRLEISVETNPRLAIQLRGHERPAHVHCRLEGDLGRIARIDQPNHYVGPDDVTMVPIAIDATDLAEPIEGAVEIVTGYGSESIGIEVVLRPPGPPIEVDDSFSKPRRDRSTATTTRAADVATGVDIDSPTVWIVGLGLFAVAISLLTAATIGSLVALVGVAIVVAGVAIALWLLYV